MVNHGAQSGHSGEVEEEEERLGVGELGDRSKDPGDG